MRADASRPVGGPAEVIDIDGQRRVPSVIAVDEDGQVVAGAAAENLAAVHPS